MISLLHYLKSFLNFVLFLSVSYTGAVAGFLIEGLVNVSELRHIIAFMWLCYETKVEQDLLNTIHTHAP